jgi:hypothetical protein
MAATEIYASGRVRIRQGDRELLELAPRRTRNDTVVLDLVVDGRKYTITSRSVASLSRWFKEQVEANGHDL